MKNRETWKSHFTQISEATSCEDNSLTISVRSRPIRSLFFPSRRFHRYIAVKNLFSSSSPAPPPPISTLLLIAYSRYDCFSHEHATRMQEGRKERETVGRGKERGGKGQTKGRSEQEEELSSWPGCVGEQVGDTHVNCRAFNYRSHSFRHPRRREGRDILPLASCLCPLLVTRILPLSLSRSLSTLLVPRMYLATTVVHHALALPIESCRPFYR